MQRGENHQTHQLLRKTNGKYTDAPKYKKLIFESFNVMFWAYHRKVHNPSAGKRMPQGPPSEERAVHTRRQRMAIRLKSYISKNSIIELFLWRELTEFQWTGMGSEMPQDGRHQSAKNAH
jgi:hypothetical protein